MWVDIRTGQVASKYVEQLRGLATDVLFFLHGDWILKVSGYCSELRMYSPLTDGALWLCLCVAMCSLIAVACAETSISGTAAASSKSSRARSMKPADSSPPRDHRRGTGDDRPHAARPEYRRTDHAVEQAAGHADTRDFLNPAQRRAIEEVLTTRDRVHGLQDSPGPGRRPHWRQFGREQSAAQRLSGPDGLIIRHCSTTPISRVFSRTCATRT